MKKEQKSNNKGFSLVELIIVIAVMAVLMGVLAPTLIGNVEKSRESTDLQNLDSIKGAVTSCMSDDAVYREVMGAVKTAGDSIAISLGTCDKTSVDNIDSKYPKLKAELTETLTDAVSMKSTAASSSNSLYIVVAKNGSISVLVASSETDAKAYKAVECSKTKDESGNAKRKLISGSSAEAATTAPAAGG